MTIIVFKKQGRIRKIFLENQTAKIVFFPVQDLLCVGKYPGVLKHLPQVVHW